MCGIAGILRFDDEPTDPRRAQAMRDALRHRGPDGDGIASLGRCTLIHTRLAVIDQADGAQPMTLDDAGLTVVFNGEIYNHAELRDELQRLGHRFTTDHSDTEVLLHGYRAWGTSLMDRLDGMWAFAIWDVGRQELLLSRDRAGQKPLFLYESGRNELLFASELSGLTAGVAQAETLFPSDLAIEPYLRLGYWPSHRMPTPLREVSLRGWVRVARPGTTTDEEYGNEPPTPPVPPATTPTSATALQQCEAALSTAVRRRLTSDVPLGAFLSAGIDSSLIAALAQHHLDASGRPPLRTFSIAMDGAQYDESAQAAETAAFLGTQHTTLQVRPGDVITDLEALIRFSGEPIADSSILPTYWLCRAAREHVTVALSGDGGDELFGGYDRYRAIGLLAKYGRLLRYLPATRHTEQRSKRARLGRLVRAARLASAPRQYLSMIQLFSDPQIQQLCVDGVDSAKPEGLPDWPHTGDPIRDAMRWDRGHYLPFDVLRKVDRASMAVALEVRSPMLSPQMLALSDQLTTRQLRAGGRPKGLLRDLAKKHLPPAVAQRRKSGFAVPIGRWFRTTLREPVRERVLDRGYMDRLGLKPGLPEQMCAEHLDGRADHTHRLFALLQLSIWHRWLLSQGR